MQVNPEQVISRTLVWFRYVVVLSLLVLLAITIARYFGIMMPIRPPEPLVLAYLAGVYWLLK